MHAEWSYGELLETSRRINWRVDDLIGHRRLDFSKPFLPETYARARALAFLSADEQLALNHIRAHGYLATFELVETFIEPFIRMQASAGSADDDPQRAAALANFADEETKHMELFRRFRREFAEGFGIECGVIGPADAIGEAILAHSPLAVAILVLGIEWMSQGHYVESVKDDAELDPQFKSLLKHHWMEEAQHAKLDGLLLRSMARAHPASASEQAVEEYLEIAAFIDGGLKQQAELDLAALERWSARPLTDDERNEFRSTQHQALRWTFLGTAMSNRSFLAALAAVSDAASRRIEAAGAAYSQPADRGTSPA